jgi:hypothetical protein
MCRFQLRFQSDQRLEPRLLIAAHPPIEDLLDGHRIEVIEPLAPLPAVADERAGFEDAQVLHDRESRQVGKVICELAGCTRTVAQHVEHPPPDRVGQRAPHGIQIGLGSAPDHM